MKILLTKPIVARQLTDVGCLYKVIFTPTLILTGEKKALLRYNRAYGLVVPAGLEPATR